MDNQQSFSWIQIGTIVIQVLAIFASYYFGRLSNKKDNEFKIMKNRYEIGYVPYIKSLYRGFLFDGFRVINYAPDIDINEMFVGPEGVFLDHLSENIHLLGPETTKHYSAFYKSFLDMLEYLNGNKDYSSAPKAFIKTANLITLSLLEDAKKISEELGLPDITEPFLENYRSICTEYTLRK